jgi:hypothetical protein
MLFSAPCSQPPSIYILPLMSHQVIYHQKLYYWAVVIYGTLLKYGSNFSTGLPYSLNIRVLAYSVSITKENGMMNGG